MSSMILPDDFWAHSFNMNLRKVLAKFDTWEEPLVVCLFHNYNCKLSKICHFKGSYFVLAKHVPFMMHKFLLRKNHSSNLLITECRYVHQSIIMDTYLTTINGIMCLPLILSFERFKKLKLSFTKSDFLKIIKAQYFTRKNLRQLDD